MNRRLFAGTLVGATLGAARITSAQERAVPVSIALGLTYLDYLDINNLDGVSCDTEDYFSRCSSGNQYQHRLLPMQDSGNQIFRISLEEVGGQEPAWIRHHALKFGPNDSYSVASDVWADGSEMEYFQSDWLAEQYPDDLSLWAGNAPGTWCLVIQRKFGQDKTARALISLPHPAYSIEVVEEAIKGGERLGFDSRAYVEPASSLEGRILALERILYEVQSDMPDAKFGTLFAYEPGDAIDDLFTIGRAAVSVDGNGFLEKAFPIMEDREGTLQVEVQNIDAEMLDTTTVLLAK